MERIELIIIIGWVFILSTNLVKNGEPKDGCYSIWMAILVVLIDWCIYHFYCGLF